MTDAPDAELLERFTRDNSEAAFTALVERHLGLVHSVALRHTANPQHAQDITQAVFIILARKANSLGGKTILPGWLYHTARLTAANFQRAETRRIRREQEAYMQSTLNEDDSANAWTQMSPLLDEAMSHLRAGDRDALVLRYFQNKSLPEVGAAMGLAERAAQKRVLRAVEKLRKFFAKRGVKLSGASLTGAVSVNSIQTAPMALVKTISTVAIAKGAAATASILLLVKGAEKIMTWTKMKTAGMAGIVVLITLATGIAIEEGQVRNNSQDKNISYFVASGKISTEFHQTPFDTNRVFKSTSKFLFSYSNGIWQVQFFDRQYSQRPSFAVPPPTAHEATMIDEKLIPGGIREIITFPNLAKDVTPSSRVQAGKFPEAGKELFLPWLSLCPNPELPVINSNLIHVVFEHKYANIPQNAGGFKINFIPPKKQFLSELIITNNGIVFLWDGKTMDYPEPFNKGFVSFDYKVLSITNCGGINFPLSAVLYEYTPLPNGKSSNDTYATGSTFLNVEQIDVGGRHLKLAPQPTRVVALDERLGLSNGMTMNYEVTNDLYLPLTNSSMARLANFYRRTSVTHSSK